jgi:hypothetical protein
MLFKVLLSFEYTNKKSAIPKNTAHKIILIEIFLSIFFILKDF